MSKKFERSFSKLQSFFILIPKYYVWDPVQKKWCVYTAASIITVTSIAASTEIAIISRLAVVKIIPLQQRKQGYQQDQAVNPIISAELAGKSVKSEIYE